VAVVAVLGLLSGSAMAVEVVNLPTPPASGGPNNGGHFRFGTVAWNKLEHQPPKIRFTIEAAFRRSYAATNFRGCPLPPSSPPPRSTLLGLTRVEGDQSSLPAAPALRMVPDAPSCCIGGDGAWRAVGGGG